MKNENIILYVNNKKEPGIGADLIDLEVETGLHLASMFKLVLPLVTAKKPGTLAYLDDYRLQIGNPVAIKVGFGVKTEPIMDGYITHLKPRIEQDPGKCVIEVWGMDKSIRMDRIEVLKDWPNKKDSDIAAEIFEKYSLKPDIDTTSVVHNEKVSTIVQRETDIRFLKRLAERNGFVCYVEIDTGYFKKPDFSRPHQAELKFVFGEEGTLKRFSVDVNGVSPTGAKMFQVDRLNKKVMEVKVGKSGQTSLGRSTPDSLCTSINDSPLVYAGKNAATGKPEMEALCKGMVQEAEMFITARGEVAGNKLGQIIKPGQMVKISGVGEAYTGLYYLSQVTHALNANGYIQQFEARRNALNSVSFGAIAAGTAAVALTALDFAPTLGRGTGK